MYAYVYGQLRRLTDFIDSRYWIGFNFIKRCDLKIVLPHICQILRPRNITYLLVVDLRNAHLLTQWNWDRTQEASPLGYWGRQTEYMFPLIT